MKGIGRFTSLAFIVALAVSGISTRSLAFSATGFVGSAAYVYAVNRSLLKRVFRPRLLIGMLILMILTGAFLGKNMDLSLGRVTLSSDGIAAGVLMVLRAFTLALLLAILASSVSEQRAIQFFQAIGLPQLVPALQVAGSALPTMIDRWPALHRSPRRIIDRWVELITAVCREADTWGDKNDSVPAQASVIIVTAGVHSGKSTFLLRLADELRRAGTATDGIVQTALLKDGNRLGYELLDLATGKSVLFAKKKPAQPGYDFIPQGFLAARDAISSLTLNRVHFVDELGKLEAKGGGHFPYVARAIRRYRGTWVLCARKDHLDPILSRLPVPPLTVVDLEATTGEAAIRTVSQYFTFPRSDETVKPICSSRSTAVASPPLTE